MSIVLYDPQTRSQLQTSQPFPSDNNVRDQDKVKKTTTGQSISTSHPRHRLARKQTGSRQYPTKAGSACCDSTARRLSDDGSATVDFGPHPPKGKEGHWRQTMPGKGFNVTRRAKIAASWHGWGMKSHSANEMGCERETTVDGRCSHIFRRGKLTVSGSRDNVFT
jgi:hypothetical protein